MGTGRETEVETVYKSKGQVNKQIGFGEDAHSSSLQQEEKRIDWTQMQAEICLEMGR